MQRSWPYLSLLVLALAAFWPLVLHPTETLYSDTSDLLAEHLPAKLFLVRSLRETGELPLWNPEQYAGSPFVHDIQVGLFYPPHLPLYFISEPAVGPFLSWLVFVHVVLAGWLMYAYGRHAGMDRLAAFTAGAGYMLAPRWMMQLFLAGHTVTQGICWIPLVILCVERAIQRRNWRWAVGGGAAYALLILGTHPQWTFYGSLLIGLWPLRLLVRERASPVGKRSDEAKSLAADFGEPGCVSAGSTMSGGEQAPREARPALTHPGSPEVGARVLLGRWVVAEIIVVLVGLALSAVQLLPTIEAAGESSRARGMGQSWSLDGAKAAATTLIGPIPDRRAEPIHWETRGGIGFGWAVFAIVGARLSGRRAIVPAAIALGMLAYALGGSYFIDRLPGFDNFRMPTRMLLTLAFPVAFLAGIGVQSQARQWCQSSVRMATIAAIILVVSPGTVAILGEGKVVLNHFSVAWWIYWLSAFTIWPVTALPPDRWNAGEKVYWFAALLVVDVMIIAIPLPGTKPIDEVFPPSPIFDYIREHNPDGHRVYDGGGLPILRCLGAGSPVASVRGVPCALGYNPLDVSRYRQFLALVGDTGERQDAFGNVFTHPIVTRLFANDETASLFDLLGHRYMLVGETLISTAIHGPRFPQLPDAYFGHLQEPRPIRSIDENYRSFDFLGRGIGPPMAVALLEHPSPFPRAFVVRSAEIQAAEPAILAQLKSMDLRRTATVEDWDSTADPLPAASGEPDKAVIQSHQPNRIIIALDGHTAGLLVLTDPWYPGWRCWVDGQEAKIWKADYAFRGVMIPNGSKEVVFKFEPRSYRRGRIISLGALIGVGLFGIAVIRRARLGRTAMERG